MRIPTAILILMPLLTVLIDTYVFFDVRHYSKQRAWGPVYAISSILCWVFLVIVLALPRRSGDSDISFIMWGIYGFTSVYIVKIIWIIFSLIGRIPILLGKSRLNMGLWIGLPMGLLMFTAMWWGVFKTRHEINVVPVTVASQKLPREFDGFSIVQFSDAHVGSWGTDTRFISALVDTINSLKPDLIVFTGDIVNRHSGELAPFEGILSRLHAPYGVFSVMGNHDYGDYTDWPDPKLKEADRINMRATQRRMGWHLLDNERQWIVRGNDSILLIGVENWGEPPFHQYGNLEKCLPANTDSPVHQNDTHYKILLSHNPEHWNRHVSGDTNIDLTLSGHTHAMQFEITLGEWKWSPSQYRYEQWGGLYERLNKNGQPTRIYVNIGCGEVAIPSRIGATPELTHITLRR